VSPWGVPPRYPLNSRVFCLFLDDPLSAFPPFSSTLALANLTEAVSLPPIDQQPPPSMEQPASPQIEIAVNAQGQIRLNGELVTVEEFGGRLRAIAGGVRSNPDKK
jgi:biopolymer transport protein ExbD